MRTLRTKKRLRPYFKNTYKRTPERIRRLLCLCRPDAEEALAGMAAEGTKEPESLPLALKAYRKAGATERRESFRRTSAAFGHRLAAVSPAERAPLLAYYRDGLSWAEAAEQSGYSESGAIKAARRILRG